MYIIKSNKSFTTVLKLASTSLVTSSEGSWKTNLVLSHQAYPQFCFCSQKADNNEIRWYLTKGLQANLALLKCL